MQIDEKDPAGSGGVHVSELVELLFSVIRFHLFALGSLQCFDGGLMDVVEQLEFFVDCLDVYDAADHGVRADTEQCRPYGVWDESAFDKFSTVAHGLDVCSN